MPTFSRAPSPPTSLPFRVRTIGHIQREPYHSTLGTYNRDIMLTVMISGTGRYIRGGKTYRVEAGTVGLITPCEDPGILMADPGTPYDHYYCRFSGTEAHSIVQRILTAQWSLGALPVFPFFRHSALEAVAEVFARTVGHQIHMRTDQAVDRMSLLDARLAEMLILLDAQPSASTLRPTSDSLQLYLHDHLADPVDLDVMAEHFSISKAHLCRVAKRELGRTIQSLWEQIKMDRARVLLAQSDLSIKEIARRVGYTDPFYFSNVFRRSTGKSPRNFRDDA